MIIKKKMKVSIIIPVHNEQDNLPVLLDKILNFEKSLKYYEVIIVDDNSTDKTKIISDRYSKKCKNIKVIHRKEGNNGMGAALKEGTKKSKGNIIIWLMGDNSDDLDTIPKFVDKIKNNADMVFGSRYIKGGSYSNLDYYKAKLSKSYSTIARILFGIKVHDITNAFRAFKKEVYNKVNLESNDFSISPEFAIKAHIKGFKLDEVPTTYRDRQSGKPKFKVLEMGISYSKLFKYLLIR